MLPAPFEQALVLTGPTASGKTQLGIDLARALDAEIISMDSMALYRGMDIGTAKPTSQQQAQVRHHLIDVRDPWESASVAWWLEEATRCASDIERRGKQVLFVGGTPLYLKALLHGLFEGPPADEGLRRELTEEAARVGSETLHRRLAELDPKAAARIHANDLRRIIRALEVYTLTGRPISSWQTEWSREAAAGQHQILWLDVPRAEIYERIDRRVEAMFAEGLVAEVERLRGGRGLSREAQQAVGYREVLDLLDGKASLPDTVALVQMRTRQFAKRQVTWFRHLPGCRPATVELTWERWRPRMKP